jgi:hypothetical protein
MFRHHRAEDDFDFGFEEDDGGDGANNLDYNAFDHNHYITVFYHLVV